MLTVRAYRMAVDLLRHLRKGLANSLGHRHGLLAAGVGEHRGELLTAEPADRDRIRASTCAPPR